MRLDASLLRRVEADEVAGLTAFGKRFLEIHGSAGRGVLVRDGWVVIALGAGMPINRSIGLGNERPATLADVEAVERTLGAFGIPPEFEVTDATADTLGAMLAKRGYTPGRSFTWYVRSVARAGGSFADGLRVDHDPDRALWARVTALGFDGRDDGEPGDVNRMLGQVTAASELPVVLAWLGGQAAGGGAMAVRGDHAALFSASTLPRFRSRGVQSALLGARVAKALEMGCDVASVKVEPGSVSERNVRRAGFRALGTKVVWARPRPAVAGG